MAKNKSLTKAREAKNDEFYTQYHDIEREISAYLEYDPDVFRGKTILLPCDDPEWSNFTRYFAQNFENFGLKKLISTSYAVESKNYEMAYVPTKMELKDPKFDSRKTRTHGKIYVLDEDINNDERIDIYDLKWEYLEGDGDFRSEEVTALRDEADFVITNPPFSLFREFLDWIVEADKKFVIIGNMNAITYKDVFPLLKNNRMWIGKGGNMSLTFKIPDEYFVTSEKMIIDGQKYATMPSICWYTNLEHGRRHEPLSLMTMADNIKFNKKLKGLPYQKYENYDAIEIPFTDAIPSDYEGVMGVPVSFLDKYCPEQFEILGCNRGVEQDPNGVYGRGSYLNGKETFKRIFIKHKRKENEN